ncbi:MAG: D-alanyl-lipoteichoic acid acyltransferase DltB (MBOAT superfamily) [Bacteriovoracaceae bacterium]|jgi:alginate O-acetyltransferase complex protein AlgI
MDLTTTKFLFFFTITFILYWALPSKSRKYLLTGASLLFILSWGIEGLLIFGVSVVIDFICAIQIGKYKKGNCKRKLYLYFAIFSNLLLWGSYKWLGLYEGKNLLIPIGLSYYSFQSLGYTISVYWNRFEPTKNFTDFILFNAFFPQLSAGPIERAENILPQISSLKNFDYSMLKKGLFLLGLGYFKKLVVADRLIFYYLEYSNHPHDFYGLEYLFLMYAGFILLYFDVSGYADIARGLGACFGIKIANNFDRPYMAQNPTDIWNRWHISVTTWMRDYIYFPIMMKTRNIPLSLFAVYIFFGFWHAINIGFIYLGLYWGLLHIIYEALRRRSWIPKFNPWLNRILFFNSLVLGGVFIAPISVIDNISTLPNVLNIMDNLDLYKLLNTDYLIIVLGTILVLAFEKYEKKILGLGGSFTWGYLLIILTIVFRYKESHLFFYFRM